MPNTGTLVALSGSYSLNANGRLNVGGTIASGVYSAGLELEGFKSGSVSFDASTIDNSTRGEGGWAVNAPGSRSCTIELTWNKKELESGQTTSDNAQALLMSMLTQSQADWSTKGINIAYLSSNGTTKSGFAGLFVPTAYSENQSGGGDADATAVECSMTLASYKDIYAITDIS